MFFFQAEDGRRYLVLSRGLGDVYKRQVLYVNELQRGELPADLLRYANSHAPELVVRIKEIEYARIYRLGVSSDTPAPVYSNPLMLPTNDFVLMLVAAPSINTKTKLRETTLANSKEK